ncbi:MAG: hypothetical protein ACREQL_08300 [Candidatus Binatia bacterium]
MACAWRAAGFLALLTPIAVAQAFIVGGGGSSKTDCLVVLDAQLNYPPDKPKRYRCADGDPTCDADGVVDGVCTFSLTVCANSTYNPALCTLVGVDSITVDHALDNGDRKFDPEFQALQNRINSGIVGPNDPPNTDVDTCAIASTFRIPVLGPFAGNVCKRGKKQVKIRSYSQFIAGVQYKDTDKLKMECEPALAGCDPQTLYAGTFDRIQKQIFDKSCAVSGCHDSQSQTGGMLLEGGAAYTNLVDVTPQNATAAGLGWKRLDATNASPETSFIYHKLTGDLSGGTLGARMPLGGSKLDDFLIDIVRLWIEAGAPQAGWVPGTF